MFVLLTSNRKQEAADLAVRCGDYKLASIISQSAHFAMTGDSYQPFVDIRNQIEYWQKHKMWQTFTASKRKIYALLAGRYCEVASISGFNWFRCFGILIWHYLP